MKYLMFVCSDGATEISAEDGAWMASASEAWLSEMDGRGIRLDGDRLRPSGDAITVRVRGDEVLHTDGPFAETKEQIAGYDLLECKDLDEAVEVASKHPMARFGLIEVRPFWTE